MSNYPDGAANDPNAPYNQKDPVQVLCNECDGEGFIDPEDYDEMMTENTCPKCEGCGIVDSDGDEEQYDDSDDYEYERL